MLFNIDKRWIPMIFDIFLYKYIYSGFENVIIARLLKSTLGLLYAKAFV